MSWVKLNAVFLGLLMSTGLFCETSNAQESSAQEKATTLIGEYLGFLDHLNIELKTVAVRGTEDTTTGLQYEYSHRFVDMSMGGNFDLYFESSGFLVEDDRNVSERRLNHKLRANLIDIVKTGEDGRRNDYERFLDAGSDKFYRRLSLENQIFQNPSRRLARELYKDFRTADTDEQADLLLVEIRALWAEGGGGDLTLDGHGRLVELEAHETEWARNEDEFKKGVSLPWLSFELNMGADTDQKFDDVELVGGAQFYGKWDKLAFPLNALFEFVRGYPEPLDYLSRQAGPYFWAGYEFVDASENQARMAVTGREDQQFTRFNAGLSYRNEVFSYETSDTEETRTVAVECSWDFYSEVDAPASIQAAGSDVTSYLKASLLWDDGMFLEYTDGRKPLDLDDSSAVSVGWRFSR